MEAGMRRLTWVVAGVVLLASGCGGDDPAGVTTTSGAPAEQPPTTAAVPADTLQFDNRQPTSRIRVLPSSDLAYDSRLGVGLYPAYPDIPGFDHLLEEFVDSGVHRIDISYSDIEYPIDWSYSETDIDPAFDRLIDNLNDRSIAVDYMVHFWDKDGHAAGEELETPRFQTEEQIQDFIDYLSDIVERYQGRIQYYTIWSEPDACGGGGIKCIEPADYVALAERVIPVIRRLDPTAKVAVAPVVLFHARDYMAELLEAEVIDEFDVIQWHGIYNVIPGADPGGQYYDDYTAIVADIKDRATANGFTGEFWCTEITFCSSDYDAGCPSPDPPLSDLQTAKYYARSIVQHLGMDVGTSYKTYRDTTGPVTFAAIGRLHTLLAGTSPAEIAVEIDTDAGDIATFGFATAGGHKMLALWIDGVATDETNRTAATLTFAGAGGESATGFDVIGGVQQQLDAGDEGGDLLIPDLLIGDGPLIVRLGG
jgi:hypothetical protein